MPTIAGRGRAVEISAAIGDQAAFGMRAIAATSERVQHGFSKSRLLFSR